MAITKNKIRKRKIRKRKIDLIIPNYSNLGYNLIIPQNNDYDTIISNI